MKRSYLYSALALVAIAAIATLLPGGLDHHGGLLFATVAATGDPKEILASLQNAFEAFRASNDERLKALETKGVVDPLVAQTVEASNAAIQEMQNKLRDLETRANRPGNENAESEVKKAALKSGFLNMLRNRPGLVPEDVRAALIEDATGQILVPEDVEAGIRRVRGRLNVMRQLASVRTTSSNRVRRRTMGELAVGWGKLETGASLVETTPVPAEAFVYVEDLYGLIRIGEDELMDTDANLSEYVDDSFGRAISDKEETGFVVGLGHGSNQPEGFTLGATVTRVNTLQNAQIKADDILNLIFAVPATYANSPDAALLVLRSTELAMRKLKDSNNQYLWQPGLAVGNPATFAGKPVYNQDDLAAIPAAATAADVAAFGDWKAGYQIVDRVGVSVKRLNELYATAGMVGFLAHARVTGYVSDAAALRILKVIA